MDAAFNLDGSLLAVGYWTYGRTLRLWDVKSGQLSYTLPAHDVMVTDTAFSPDGNLLVEVCDNGAMWLWGIPQGQSEKQ